MRLFQLVLLIALAGFTYSLALADGGASTPSAPQNFAALWPMIGLLIAMFAGWGIPKLATAYSFFHTTLGAVFIGFLGAVVGSVIPIFQSGSVTWVALAWAAVSGGTSFFARLNPSTTKDEPPAKSPAARPGATMVLPLFLAMMSAFMVLPGCGTAGGQALGKCELGQLVGHSQNIAVDVASIATAGGANWQEQLGSLGASLVPGQLECVVQAVAAAWSSSHAALSPERKAALERLQIYLNAHPATSYCPPYLALSPPQGDGPWSGASGAVMRCGSTWL